MMYNCYACRGKNANNGKALVIARIDRSFGRFLRFIRNPDSAVMPIFPEEVLSRQDAADSCTWFRDCLKDKSHSQHNVTVLCAK